mmetsp:Transcript_36965/g.27331  ORF Transcript_36965/g.27331 Transcript_36965/m.27331 type:complete len:91 (+) Transcript_36965:119-391(+)
MPEKPFHSLKQKEHLVGGVLPAEAFSDEFRKENDIRMKDDAYFQVNYLVKHAMRQAGLEVNGTLNTNLIPTEERERFAILFGVFQCNPHG